jgi:hypothetical protein
MLGCKDAAGWIVVAVFVGCLGCATLGRSSGGSNVARGAMGSELPPPVPATTQPPPPSAPRGANDRDALERLVREAEQACAQSTCYICRLKRREAINGKSKPEEVLVFKFRSRPFSVHFKWLGDEGKGREVIYVAGQDEKLHILTAGGDIPLTPAGRRIDLPINSILVKSASKYPITEAGVCRIVARFRRLLEDEKRGLPGLSIRHLGVMQRPDYPTPLECVELTLPPNREPEAPNGGRRFLGFDPITKWPVLSATFDPNGREIDYYCFDRFQINVKLDDEDFDPNLLWPAKGTPSP